MLCEVSEFNTYTDKSGAIYEPKKLLQEGKYKIDIKNPTRVEIPPTVLN